MNQSEIIPQHQPIDFVILWVDGGDPKWLKKKKEAQIKHTNSAPDSINSAARYRDWENLKYWFRAIENFAPWVNNIFLVVDNQIPNFLNVNHPKLKIIDHSEFMLKQDLPTFNSNAIELNLKNIKDLSEHFVLFNDDMFIVRPVKPSHFFKKGYPRDIHYETSIHPDENDFGHCLYNNIQIINRHYNKKDFRKKNPFKCFHPLYGIRNASTLLMSLFKGFRNLPPTHGPQPFLKTYFDKLWELEPKACSTTSHNKFRAFNDISQYAVRDLQILDGNFIPKKFDNISFMLKNEEDLKKCATSIIHPRTPFVCINDSDSIEDFGHYKRVINSAFEKILPIKSEFEK